MSFIEILFPIIPSEFLFFQTLVQVLGKSLTEIEEESQQQTKTISTTETTSSAETTVETSVQQNQQRKQSIIEQTSTTTTSSSATETTTKSETSSGGHIDVNQTIVIVPGHQKVEFDPVTNSKTVTEKTTTGYQQTITTVTPEGTTRTQIKTFFDAVEIPSDEIVEEEETIEETETIEPGTRRQRLRPSPDLQIWFSKWSNRNKRLPSPKRPKQRSSLKLLALQLQTNRLPHHRKRIKPKLRLTKNWC